MSQREFRYFDHNATTPIAPEVIEAMMPYFSEKWGNPSSAYGFGSQLHQDIEQARARVAELIHGDPEEMIFTSGGTESNNTAWNSALRAQPGKRHIVTSAVEHSSIMKYAETVRKQGVEVSYVPVDQDGCLDLHLLNLAIRPDTALVSIMWANNETGVIFPMAEVAAICRSHGAPFHTDAVQAAGKTPIDTRDMQVAFMSLSAHKLYAPKGIGCLYVRSGTPFHPFVVGGGQEKGRRGGTENVPYFAGFGRAAELALDRQAASSKRMAGLRDRMEAAIFRSIKGVLRNGASNPRLPNTSNLCFRGVEGEALLLMLDRAGICASSGSACTTGSLKPSHVLSAMGLSPDDARSSLRFSLGTQTTEQDVDELASLLPEIVETLRRSSPASDGAFGGSPFSAAERLESQRGEILDAPVNAS